MRLGLSIEPDPESGFAIGQSCDITGCDQLSTEWTKMELFPSESSYWGWGDYGITPESVVPTVGFSGAAAPVATITTGIPGFDAAVAENPGTSILDIIKAGIGAWQLNAQQKAFLETNQMLIEQGRPPIAWDQFTPTASVGVAVDSQTRNMVLLLGLGALALGAFAVMRK